MSVPRPVREDGPLARGRAALASGQWEAARTAFGEALRDSPSEYLVVTGRKRH
jgi:hypothetical protein